MGQSAADIEKSRSEWERAEIERSISEAARETDAGLRASNYQIQRYMDPPANTPYSLEYAFHLLGDVRGKTVLDFGCGSGENTLLLAKRGAKPLGLDISAALIGVARRRLRINGVSDNIPFIVASASQIPLHDESVDVVFGIAILHHLDLKATAQEVRRILKPGGRAIFQEPMRNSKALAFLRKLVPYRQPDISPFEQPLKNAEIELLASHFRSCKTRAFKLPHIKAMQLLGFTSLLPRLQQMDRASLDRWPSLGWYATINVLELAK